MWRLLVLFLVLVTSLACGDDAPTELEESFESGAPSLGPADAPGIPFVSVQGFVPPATTLETEQRRLISTAATFERFFHQPPPAWVDFSQNWLVFYSTGPAPEGTDAKITQIQLSPTGKSLQVITQQLEPQCARPQAEGAWSLVEFKKPSVRPQSVRYYADDNTLECATCDDVNAALENSAQGVWFTSESDYPFEVFTHENTALLGDSSLFQSVVGIDGTAESVPFDEWFDKYMAVPDDTDPYFIERAEQFGRIRTAFTENLTNLQVFRVGEIEVHIFIVGQTACGKIAGLRTISIET